jgi:hypothetical protein
MLGVIMTLKMEVVCSSETAECFQSRCFNLENHTFLIQRREKSKYNIILVTVFDNRSRSMFPNSWVALRLKVCWTARDVSKIRTLIHNWCNTKHYIILKINFLEDEKIYVYLWDSETDQPV